MSVWMELHCDMLADNNCETERNDSWGLRTFNNQKAVANGFRLLRKTALRRGWLYRRGTGWTCPNCLARQQEQEQ